MSDQSKSATQAILDERERLARELEALQTKIKGLDLALDILSGTAGSQRTPLALAPASRPQPRDREASAQRGRGISHTIRELLKDAGEEGLSVQETIDLAAQRGQEVNKTSASSLLSRMKRSGEVVYRRKKYVLV